MRSLSLKKRAGITDLDVSLVGSLARGHLVNNGTTKETDIDIYIEGKARDPKVRKLEEMLYAIATKMNLDVDARKICDNVIKG